MSTIAQTLKALQPTATKVADIPAELTITVVEAAGQARSKFVGFLDDAHSLQVSIYLPEGMSFPKDGYTLVVGDVSSKTTPFNVEQSEQRTRKGSAKLVWGDLKDSDSFGAAVFAPPRASLTSVTAVL
jgi:hypothetical protein